LEEFHRFPTGGAFDADGSYRWNINRILSEIFAGLRKVAADGRPVRGVSADSWGVDYVWLGAAGNPLGKPRHYRDARNDAAFKRLLAKIPRETIFAESGIQFLALNTLTQFEAELHERTLPAGAARFLFIADYVNAQLGGRPVVEESLASTSQLYNPRTRSWSLPLARALGLPENVLPEIVPSATVTGTLSRFGRVVTGLPAGTPVIATCSHDTGAAVFAVPADSGSDWAYLSSGTWSLLGAELPAPVVTAGALEANFTNEIGFAHSVRFLKNIVGMWIVQECRRAWSAAGNDISYADLDRLAAAAEPRRSFINPADPRFAAPGKMPQKIADYCRETAQPEPRTAGEFARAVFESLALFYTKTLATLDALTGRRTRRLHVVGGGSRNALLNQATADAAGIEVIAGPVEATAAGNILLQALALGDLPDHAAARAVVRASFPVQTFTPADGAAWREARERFAKLP
ncbi:MAG: rhamnulokinase, partial [Puniceicoccales bacterium]|nr:rhamnulokinase [Puniceicoccales bacterium]